MNRTRERFAAWPLLSSHIAINKTLSSSVYRVVRTGDVERTRTKATSVNLFSARMVKSTLKSSRCLEMDVSRPNASTARSG